MKSWPPKDPSETLDYLLDWSTRDIAGDTILTAVATVATGNVEVESTSIVGQMTRTWLSGGSNGTPCTVRIAITTAAGRSMDETVAIRIKDR